MTYKLTFVLLFFFLSCVDSSGKLKTIAVVDSSLKELSALETIPNSNLLWSIQDSGNANTLYGLDSKGQIIKNISISGIYNKDWEDLTTDNEGAIYIGDFGNNNKKRKEFFIYKISNLENTTTAETISFKLPKTVKTKDFEAFFLWQSSFYLFSKESKKTVVIKVPNRIGKHTGELITKYKFKKKNTRITSADISKDGKKIILLNSDKVIVLEDFKEDEFFNGTIRYLDFKHKSQKEGLCFKDQNTILINDESQPINGGRIYEFSLN